MPNSTFKSNFFLMIVYVAITFQSFANVDKTLIYRTNNAYAPFEYVDDKDGPSGFCVDVFTAIANEQGIEYKIKSGERFQNQIKSVNSPNCIITFLGEPVDTSQFVYSDPIGLINLSILSSNISNISKLDDLKDKTVAVQMRSPIIHILEDSGIRSNLITFNDISEAIKLHESTDFDAIICSNELAYYYIKKYDLSDLTVSPILCKPMPICFAMHRNAENIHNIHIINFGISKIKRNGTYNSIYSNWFIPNYTLTNKNCFPYLIVIIVIIGIIIAAFIFYRYHKIRLRKTSVKTTSTSILNNLEDKYRDSPFSVAIVNKDGECLFYNIKCATLFKLDNIYNLHTFRNKAFKRYNLINTANSLDNFSYIFDCDIRQTSEELCDEKHYSIKVSLSQVEYCGKITEFFVALLTDCTNYVENKRNLDQLSIILEQSVYASGMKIYLYNIEDETFYIQQGYKYEKTLLKYKNAIALIHPHFQALFNEFFITVQNGDRKKCSEVFPVYNSKIGAYKYYTISFLAILDSSNNVTHVVVTLFDANTNQAKQKELESVKSQLELAISSGNFTAWNYFPDNRVFSIIKQGYQVRAVGLDDLIKHIHPEDRIKVETICSELMLGQYNNTYFVVRYILPDNKEYAYIECTLSVIHNKDLSINRFAGVYRDITDSYRQKKELEEYKLNTELVCSKGGITHFEYDIQLRQLDISPYTIEQNYGITFKNIAEYISPQSEYDFKRLVQYLTSQNDLDYNATLKIKSPVTHTWVYLEIDITPLLDSQGQKAVKYVGAIKDCTRIIALNDRLVSLLEQNNIVLSNIKFGLGLLSPNFELIWENFETLGKDNIMRKYHTGQICYEAAHNRNSPCPDCPIKQSIESQTTVTFNRSWKGRDFKISATPAYAKDGRYLGNVIKVE